MKIPDNLKKSALLAVAGLALTLAGCNELDNYDAPSGGIHGSILDAATNEQVPLPVQGSSGVIINMFEQSSSATKSIDFYAKENGTYENSQVFNGDYKVVVNGPFVQVAENTVTIKGRTELNFTVVPYSRIKATASASGKSITITYNVTATSPDFTISEVYGYWNFAPGIDNSGNNYAEKVTSKFTSGTWVFDLENSSVFKSNLYKIAGNGNKVYFRIGAKTNGIINYSHTIEITF
ncbi:MAG: DUF3823 domain-containing protein [Prolixibacteraceae bacterium]